MRRWERAGRTKGAAYKEKFVVMQTREKRRMIKSERRVGRGEIK